MSTYIAAPETELFGSPIPWVAPENLRPRHPANRQLRQARQAAGLSRRELATLSGVSLDVIIETECLKRYQPDPPAAVLERLLAACGC